MILILIWCNVYNQMSGYNRLPGTYVGVIRELDDQVWRIHTPEVTNKQRAYMYNMVVGTQQR